MRQWAICVILVLASCKTTSKEESEAKFFGQGDKGPSVDTLVKPDQEKWLIGQVQQPNSSGIKQITVLGDSLSDPGNLNKRTLGLFIPPRVFYKSRWSNGPIWADYVSAGLGWTITNYAVGGAQTRTTSIFERIAIPSFLQQIQEHQWALKKMNFEDNLLVIWIGPNNYIIGAEKAQDAQGKPLTDKVDSISSEAVQDIREGLDQLRKIGFRKFVVGTMPELGVINRNPNQPIASTPETLFAVTAAHNQKLRTMLASFAKQAPEIEVTVFQAYEINQKTIAAPSDYGFKYLDVPCYLGSLQGQFYGNKEFCAEPSLYKYWEYIHPASKMQCFFASQFLADLSAAGTIAGYDQAATDRRCLEL